MYTTYFFKKIKLTVYYITLLDVNHYKLWNPGPFLDSKWGQNPYFRSVFMGFSTSWVQSYLKNSHFETFLGPGSFWVILGPRLFLGRAGRE